MISKWVFAACFCEVDYADHIYHHCNWRCVYMTRQNLELLILLISTVVHSCKCFFRIRPYATCANKTPHFSSNLLLCTFYCNFVHTKSIIILSVDMNWYQLYFANPLDWHSSSSHQKNKYCIISSLFRRKEKFLRLVLQKKSLKEL